MKRIMLFILSTAFHSLIMGQQQASKVLFEMQHINVYMNSENNMKSYLTGITVYKPVNFYAPMDSVEFDKVEFTVHYMIKHEDKLSQLIYSYIAHFAKDSAGYKIFESDFLSNWLEKDHANAPFREMSFEASPSECVFVGYSDNETLLAVKVWNYLKKQSPLFKNTSSIF